MAIPHIRTPMHRAKKGEPPSVDWARWVEESIRRLQEDKPIPYRPVFPTSPKTEPFWTEISTVPDSDPLEYQVTVTQGYLIYQNATASESEDGVTGWISPKIDSIDMEDAEVQPLPLPDVASWVYLRVKTDADGAPKFDGESVTIEAFDAKQESVHHVRPSPSGGEEEGDYYFLILQTEGNGGTPEAPRVVRRLTGNVELRNQLVEISNIGGKRELYKGYLVGPDDKHEVRSLEQLEGEGESIIKDLGEGDPEADPPVPAEEEGDTIPFKRIAPGERAQIEVRTADSGDIIVVEGNGFLNGITIPGGGRIDVDDGLVTNLLQGADGWWGTVTISFSASGASTLELILTYEAGLLISVETTVAGVIAGTEGAPGNASLGITDT